jgi:hypothetical protein
MEALVLIVQWHFKEKHKALCQKEREEDNENEFLKAFFKKQLSLDFPIFVIAG